MVFCRLFPSSAHLWCAGKGSSIFGSHRPHRFPLLPHLLLHVTCSHIAATYLGVFQPHCPQSIKPIGLCSTDWVPVFFFPFKTFPFNGKLKAVMEAAVNVKEENSSFEFLNHGSCVFFTHRHRGECLE